MDINNNDVININGRSIKILQTFNGITRSKSGNEYTEVFLYAKDQTTGIHYYIPKTVIDKCQSIVPYETTINNFACNGNISTNKYAKQHRIWSDMIYRCYKSTNSLYPYFGGIGAQCCTAWGCFEYFMRDWYYIKNINIVYNNPYGVFVIDFIRNIDDIPKEDRIYRCDNTIIRKFYGSQVGAARNLVKEKNGTPFIPNKNYYRDKYNKSRDITYDDINPEKALRGCAKPEEFVSKEVWPLKGPIVPIDIHATNKNVELKEMVTIVDKNKKSNQDKDKK